jgi:superfamily I DNA and/or RNA helicase
VRSKWAGSKVSNDIGFLKDFRRVNVALTRAKYSLWVVANCDMLNQDPLWNLLIDDAQSRNLIAESRNLAKWTDVQKRSKHAGNRSQKGRNN